MSKKLAQNEALDTNEDPNLRVDLHYASMQTYDDELRALLLTRRSPLSLKLQVFNVLLPDTICFNHPLSSQNFLRYLLSVAFSKLFNTSSATVLVLFFPPTSFALISPASNVFLATIFAWPSLTFP